MSHLWTSNALIDATGGRPLGSLPAGIGGISIDTRSLQPGDAFFAIKGDTLDGHDFATAAVKAGASVLIVAEGKLPALGRLSAPMIVVPDVLSALERLGAAARERSRARIIAVTGSAGKTSTKEALRHVLSTVGKVHASDKSFNNHWGVPLTLARMPDDCDYAVFEIGMNHPGEIRPLVKLVRPEIAIVTLIAAAHLGHFRDLDEIAEAKAEIFEGVTLDGTVLLNRDDSRFELLAGLARAQGIEHILGFGENEQADVRLLQCSLHAESSDISVIVGGQELAAKIGVPGRHTVQNVLALLGAAYVAGAELGPIAAALADLSAESGRGRRHLLSLPGGEATLIDESYNANPASMRAAIALLDATPVSGGGRRIAVLGDMLELGSYSAKLHSRLADVLRNSRTDLVFLAGPEMKALAGILPSELLADYRGGAEELKPLLLDALRPGDVVVVKSSKGIGFSRLVDALVTQFPALADRSTPVLPD